jgi:hypothetical protein
MAMKYTQAMPRLAELNMSTSGLAVGNSLKINVRLKIWYPPSLMIYQNLSSDDHPIKIAINCGALKVSPDFQTRNFIRQDMAAICLTISKAWTPACASAEWSNHGMFFLF